MVLCYLVLSLLWSAFCLNMFSGHLLASVSGDQLDRILVQYILSCRDRKGPLTLLYMLYTATHTQLLYMAKDKNKLSVHQASVILSIPNHFSKFPCHACTHLTRHCKDFDLTQVHPCNILALCGGLANDRHKIFCLKSLIAILYSISLCT